MKDFACEDDKKIADGNGKMPEVDRSPQNQSTWVSVRRYVGAVFIYLIYWFTIWEAIKQIIGVTLSPKQAEELVENDIINSVREYGWGDHYIWFLITFCLATYCSASLAGATAKKRGVVVAGIANLPIVVLFSFCCVCLYISKIKVEPPIAWGIILPISVLGSIYLSIVGGLAGERWQNSMFSSKTIFGIRPIHWWWLIFPLHFVIQVLIPKIVAALGLLVGATQTKETKYSVVLFLMFVVFATFIYFVAWGWFKTFILLSGKSKTNLSRGKIVLKVLFYLWGIPIFFEVFCVLISILFR